MKRVIEIVMITVTLAGSSNSFAGCVCDDWVKRSGYCVDYIKFRIPSFPVPKDVAAIKTLTNDEVKEVKQGDVAIFNLSNYWHVAYVEKVHLDQQGNATTIDVSEMNFGGQMSSEDFKNKWGLTSESELKRAQCCGVTKSYGLTSTRQSVEISSVHQIWSPGSPVFQVLTKLLHSMDIELPD